MKIAMEIIMNGKFALINFLVWKSFFLMESYAKENCHFLKIEKVFPTFLRFISWILHLLIQYSMLVGS